MAVTLEIYTSSDDASRREEGRAAGAGPGSGRIRRTARRRTRAFRRPVQRHVGQDQVAVHPVFGEIRAVGPFLAHKLRILGYPVGAVPSAACYRLGSDRGSPNQGSTLLSKRVMAQIRSPVRVRTYRPVPWRMPAGARR